MCSLRRKGSYWALFGVRVSALLCASERTSSSGILCIHCICPFGLSMNERHTSKTLAFHSHYTDVARTNTGCRGSLQNPFYCHPASLHNWHSTDGKGKTNSWDIVSPVTFPPRQKGCSQHQNVFFFFQASVMQVLANLPPLGQQALAGVYYLLSVMKTPLCVFLSWTGQLNWNTP